MSCRLRNERPHKITYGIRVSGSAELQHDECDGQFAGVGVRLTDRSCDPYSRVLKQRVFN